MSGTTSHQAGDVIRRREVLHTQLWIDHPVTVVEEQGDQLAVLLEPGSRFTFYPHPHGPHPWSGQDHWQGPTVLQVYRHGCAYSVWRSFEAGVFTHWYVNFEAPIIRHERGFDTVDHGLDLIIDPNGNMTWKDVEHLSDMRATGRMGDEEVLGVLDAATEVTKRIASGDRWWDRWDHWSPNLSVSGARRGSARRPRRAASSSHAAD